jgi:translocation and assembly module TamB
MRKLAIAFAGIAGAVLVGIAALTMSEVGRDAVRGEVERQFARSFDGRLEIGEIRGNLFRTFYTSDLRLRDAQGRVVLAVDSATFRPSWRTLFDRTVTTGRIDLYRPRITITYAEDGPNVEGFFRRTGDRSTGPEWSFDVAEVRLHGGSLVTVNDGYRARLVDEGIVFDYTNTDIASIDGRIRVVAEGDGPGRSIRLQIRELRGVAMAPSLGETRLSGTLALTADGVDLADVVLESGASRLSFGASYASSSSSSISLSMSDAAIDSDLVRSIVPSFPYADKASVSLRASGPIDDLYIEYVSIARGSSHLSASGNIRELPKRLRFEIESLSGEVTYEDLAAVDPSIDDDRLHSLGVVNVSGIASGVLDWDRGIPRSSASGRVDIASDAGRVDGPFQLSFTDDGTRLETRLRLRDVIPDMFIPGVVGSRVSGQLLGDLAYSRDGDATGRVDARIRSSRLAGRSIDSLRVSAIVAGNAVSGSAMLLADGGRAAITGSVSRRGLQNAIDARMQMTSFDLAQWIGLQDVGTRLTGAFEVESAWTSPYDLTLRIDADFDSSSVDHSDRRVDVPPHRMHAVIEPSETGLSARVWGDVLEMSFDSDANLAVLSRAADAWRPRIIDILDTERRKRRHEPGEVATYNLQEQHIAGVSATPPLSFSVTGEVHRSEWVATIAPSLVDLRGHLGFAIRVRSTGDSLLAAMSFQSDSLWVPRAEGRGISADASLTLTSNDTWPYGARLSATLRADAISSAGERFRNSRLSAKLLDGTGSIAFRTTGSDDDERLLFRARTSIGAAYNHLQIDEFAIEARGAAWSLTSTQTMLQYADALVIPSLELASHSTRTAALQRVRLAGTLSASPADTLSATLEAVSLRDLTGMANIRAGIDGILDGRISITGLLTQPEVTGEISVPRFLLDGRPLGRLTLSSNYIPGRTDVGFDARISPIGTDEAALQHAGIRAGAATNDVRLGGRFRLPVPGTDRRLVDSGMLDLTLTARSVHPFFFENIFHNVIRDVDGRLSGTGTITGDFRRPVFNAQVSLTDGAVRVPAFNLAYQVEGDATVDRDGIRLHAVRVSDPTGGQAVVDGGILFNEYRYFSLDLRGRLQNTQFMNVLATRDLAFYGDVRGSGTVTLTGPLHQTMLQTNDATISPESRIFIAIQDETTTTDPGFIVFADADGSIPDMAALSRRETLLARPQGERPFIDGLEMDLTVAAAQNVTVHLVIDPLMGDVINATGSGRIQLQRLEGDFYTFGTFNVTSGDYLFTAGDVFVRRFLIDGGSITWDGPPNNAAMDIRASYRTRASPAGLNLPINSRARIPLIVHLHIMDRVSAPLVDLNLAIDRSDREVITAYESIEALLNQPDRSAEYATSVLLTNSFLLTTSMGTPGEGSITSTRNQLAFTSLSQLVSSQLNRYLNHALPNLDVNVGFLGESTQDLDVTYGVALSLLDERLIIRGQGLYQNESAQSTQQNLLDEFVVEVRLSNTVSVEVFYRREGDILGADQTLANTTGAGLSYETQFTTWGRFVDRLFGWMRRSDHESAEIEDDEEVIAAGVSSSPN